MTTKTGTATDYLDVLLRIGEAVAVGSAFGKTYSGTGNGKIATGYAGGPASVAETFTITATDMTTFDVVGTETGSIGPATVGTPFSHARINFTIVEGSTPFAAGDEFTLSTAPPWSRLRWGGRTSTTQIFGSWANAQNAFDPVDTTGNFAGGTVPGNVGIHYPTAIEVRELTIGATQQFNTGPALFVLEYSDNGVAWSTAQSFNAAWTIAYQRQKFPVPSVGAHLHWRVRVTASQSGSDVQIADIGMHPSVGSGQDFTKRFEAAWIAPGNGGQEVIPIQIYTNEDRNIGAYNLCLSMSLGWGETGTIEQQLSTSGPRVISMWQSATPYWIVHNGGRFLVGLRVSTIYTGGGAGAFRAWDTPDVYPRPWFVAGAGSDPARVWTNRSADHRTMQDPGRYGFVALWPDSVWRDVTNRYESGGSDGDGSATGQGRTMWPASIDLQGNIRGNMRENLDGSFPLAQCVIVSSNPMGALGELDGVFWTPGLNNAPERIENQGGFEHVVLANIYRAQAHHFWAMRLD